MIKLIVFDLDNTLAPLGGPIAPADLTRLQDIENAGTRIAVCSGKPLYYLCGFFRQASLKCPILIGENGAVVQTGVSLPPADYSVVDADTRSAHALRTLKSAIQEAIPDLWFQPNEVMLTPFPRNDREFDQIADILASHPEELAHVDVYRHIDSFDISPKGITKASGIRHIAKMLGITPDEILAVGDGPNDYPMFEYAGSSIGINIGRPEKVTWNVGSIAEALELIPR